MESREVSNFPASRHAHYDHYSADQIARLDGFYGRVEQSMALRLRPWIEGNRVLDLGCGFGSLVDRLRAFGYAAVGVDKLGDFIEAGRRRYPLAELVLQTGEQLPFADQSIDTVILKDVIHHIIAEGDVSAFLGEIRRVCRRRLIVVDPNPTLILRLSRKLIGHVDPECSARQAEEVLRQAGWSIQHREFHEVIAFPLSGGYVGRPMIKSARLQEAVIRLDEVLLRLLRRCGLAPSLCWRYTIVADTSKHERLG